MPFSAKSALKAALWPMVKGLELAHRSLPPINHISEPIPTVKESGTRRHWVIACLTATTAYACIYILVVAEKGGWLLMNPLTAVGAGLSAATGSVWPSVFTSMLSALLVVALMTWLVYTLGKRQPKSKTNLMEEMVLAEERRYREGAENWRWHQRIWACFLFGTVHLFNLIVPFGLVLLLAVGGGVFMNEYLRKMRQTGSRPQALGACAALHYRYNLVVLFGFPIYMLATLTTIFIRELA